MATAAHCRPEQPPSGRLPVGCIDESIGHAMPLSDAVATLPLQSPAAKADDAAQVNSGAALATVGASPAFRPQRQQQQPAVIHSQQASAASSQRRCPSTGRNKMPACDRRCSASLVNPSPSVSYHIHNLTADSVAACQLRRLSSRRQRAIQRIVTGARLRRSLPLALGQQPAPAAP